jgi:PPOX class probable F420-dependent enzyme
MFNLTREQISDLLKGRHIASIGTENPDGSIHLTAVWYVYDNGAFYIATSSRSRKARNVAARPKASVMVDVRSGGGEHGVSASGRAEIMRGDQSQKMNGRVHSRYLSQAALADARIGPVFRAMDDVTIRLTPTSWISWDTAAVDAQFFGGLLGKTPGCFLPLGG